MHDLILHELKQAQAIMLIASAAAVAAKTYSGVGGSSSAVAAAELGPALTRSLSLRSSTVGEGALSQLQAGKGFSLLIICLF